LTQLIDLTLCYSSLFSGAKPGVKGASYPYVFDEKTRTMRCNRFDQDQRKTRQFELAFFTFELMFIKCGTKWNLPAIQTKALRRRFPAKENGQKQIRNI
jgi:hypothetical protein